MYETPAVCAVPAERLRLRTASTEVLAAGIRMPVDFRMPIKPLHKAVLRSTVFWQEERLLDMRWHSTETV